jgi:hypothetical protein
MCRRDARVGRTTRWGNNALCRGMDSSGHRFHDVVRVVTLVATAMFVA